MHKRNITYKKYTTNKICNECIRKIYQQYFENPIPENMPILEDLYDALLSHGNKKAERIDFYQILSAFYLPDNTDSGPIERFPA